MALSACQLKRYPAYKDSGMDWVGEIPRHWQVKPLKYLTSFSTGWTPPTGREDLYDGDHLWATIGDLGPKCLLSTARRISDAAIREGRLRIVRAGSLLFSFKLSVGTVSIAGSDMYTNEAIAAFGPSKYIDTGYLYWSAPMLLPHNRQDNIYGAPLLSRERIAHALILAPPVSEQRLIAGFLDCETAKIDALIVRNEGLIELLQEKRGALVRHAVTKGLDRNATLENSRVRWSGETPAHWERVAMSRVSTAVSGGTPAKEQRAYWDGNVPWVSPKDMKKRVIDSSEETVTERALLETGIKLVEPPAVLIVVRGMILVHTFPVAITSVPVTINQDMKALRFRPGINPLFMTWLLEGIGREMLPVIVEEAAHGTRAIRMDQWRTVTIALPPEAEQRAIVAHLDRETQKIELLVFKIRQAVNKLSEFRTSLISAAVTGRIDVREEVA